ncbi:P-loop containing nucleoside triphosphate hydrolase protein [Sodiomyces alkalinus F11]|uniref:P-loop containing nucleoside triphosphate hydrolase protein n=1 Tax=Sodiomyces alkalinus (strain CBS 110278 / VKM F-3762 / F11) TaxID=1314773 RepID=A0A3N2PYJ5_SODAK|nr:P-loop containing nucleoside triphosphate hydrolase protein [Sodiomyces alkalinus F11]ROT39577.1 P-loop containing nucleoside triphosphate hydrolase protein [Sodiomyces alkalinus F11]
MATVTENEAVASSTPVSETKEQLPEQPPSPASGGDDKKDTTEKPKNGMPLHKQAVIFFRLLFAAQPTWLDVTLIILGTIFAIAAGTPFPLMAILFGQLVDDLNDATCAATGSTDVDPFSYGPAINSKVLQMVYIAIAAFVLIYAYILAWGVISQRLAQRLRIRYLQALLRQPPSFFDARVNVGEVSSRLHGDITAIQAGTSEKVGICISTLSFFVTAFVVAFTREARLAGMLTSMVPAFLLMSLVGGAFLSKLAVQMSNSVASASSLAGECLSNISVVQAFGAAPRLEAKFASLVSDANKAGIRKAAVAALQAGLLYFIAYSGNALAFWQGSILIAETIEGRGSGTSVGHIYTIILVLVDACVMLGSIAPLMPLFGGASAAYQRLLEDIEYPSLIDGTSETGHALTANNVDASGIKFNNVSFAYPTRPEQPVLRNLNLSFPAGKYTAIVGLSGSGKSTIASLIARLQDPAEGTITIDGHDLRDVNVRSLRSLVGFVQQEPSLLNASILSNIAFGLVNSPNPSHQHLKDFFYGPKLAELAEKGNDIVSSAPAFGPEAVEIVELVRQAAEQADAASFIERLENGYGSNAGPKGTLVSGGQRQRVALAQALIRDPRILVLDEATSALDSASERRIQEAVERAAKHRTVISIAHRLSTIRNADNIVVMDAGQVVEQGTYAELMARGDGAFRRMADLQTLSTKDWTEGGSVSGDSLDTSTLKTEGPATSERMVSAQDEDGGDGKKPKGENEEEQKDTEEPKTELDTKQSLGFVVKGLGRLVRPSLGWLVVAMIAAVLVGATFSSAALILGFTVGELNPCSSTVDRILSMGQLFSGLMFMLAVVELFANFFAWSCFGVVAEKLLYVVRVLSFRSLMEQPMQWHQAETPAKLLGIITKDSAAIGGFSGSTIGTVFAVAVNFLVAIILSHIIAWKIAIVALASIPLLLGAGIMQLRMLARYEEKNAGAFADATAVAVEAVQSIRTVASLSLEREIMGTYGRLLRGPQKLIFRASASTNVWLALTHTSGTLIYCLSYWWGSRLIMRGEYTQTQFFIILIAMLVSAQLWGTMFTLAPEFSRARTAVSRTMNILSLGSTKDFSKTGVQAKSVTGWGSGSGSGSGSGRGRGSGGDSGYQPDQDIESVAESSKTQGASSPENRGVKITFTNVWFAYPNRPDVPVLDDISFTIQPGQFCGLVGPSGAGKSTIMSLVQRLYTPISGTVLLDGHDMACLPATSPLRDAIALVPQDPTLFDGSVRFNVSLGAKPGHDPSDAEIEEACRLANVHDVIAALPEGYDTECGPGATRLSGGQRQRLAIARALVRRPRLLLLDESTSALDAASEAALQQGLERASRGTTVLAITHRLHTVQRADVIFVVEGGRIVDQGRHVELMERRESYRVNAMQQMLQ